jgi:hypothetical protein
VTQFGQDLGNSRNYRLSFQECVEMKWQVDRSRCKQQSGFQECVEMKWQVDRPMTMTLWPVMERPREKLLSGGAKQLSDAELLAVIIQNGRPGMTAVDVARKLLTRHGGLNGILTAHGLISAGNPALERAPSPVSKPCKNFPKGRCWNAYKARMYLLAQWKPAIICGPNSGIARKRSSAAYSWIINTML